MTLTLILTGADALPSGRAGRGIVEGMPSAGGSTVVTLTCAGRGPAGEHRVPEAG